MWNFEYEYNGNLLDIEYTYHLEEPDEIYDFNGNPGTPGTASSIEIHKIWCALIDKNNNNIYVDIIGLIEDVSNLRFEDIEFQILKNHE